MVDLADRGEREAALAKRLGKAMQEARKLLLAAIEDGQIDESEWAQIAGAFQSALQMELESTMLAAGMAAAEALNVGIDGASLHARAMEWARQYSYELVSKLDGTNRQLLQQTIGDYFSERLTLSDVEARLTQAFGPVRAERIAITEVTRASSQGEIAFQDELRQMGLQPVLVWNTARDDKTCPLCGPLDGKAQGDDWNDPPPRHVSCRCWTTTELKDATR